MNYTLMVNGERRVVDADADTPLLWVIRDHLELTGTKFGCGMAMCGACTVHLNGEPVRACVTPVSDVGDQAVTTIEALGSREGKAIQAAWRDDPSDPDVCETFFSIAVEVDQPAAAAEAILPSLRTALRKGEFARAVDYWYPLASRRCEVALEPTASPIRRPSALFRSYERIPVRAAAA